MYQGLQALGYFCVPGTLGPGFIEYLGLSALRYLLVRMTSSGGCENFSIFHQFGYDIETSKSDPRNGFLIDFGPKKNCTPKCLWLPKLSFIGQMRSESRSELFIETEDRWIIGFGWQDGDIVPGGKHVHIGISAAPPPSHLLCEAHFG